MGGCVGLKQRTSPLYIIHRKLLKGAKGEIGMTKCPTYNSIKEFASTGYDVLVTLLEKGEFEKLSVPRLRESVVKAGLESLWFPIVDQSVPRDLSAFDKFMTKLVTRIKRGKRIIVHCKKGHGRTGMIACCCLIKLGYSWDNAVRTVRAIRKDTSILESIQINFIKEYYMRQLTSEN